jgi:hypothetical protein
MTTYTWNPSAPAVPVDWNTPSDWLPASVPNSPERPMAWKSGKGGSALSRAVMRLGGVFDLEGLRFEGLFCKLG